MALQLAQLAVVLALIFSVGSLAAGRRMAIHRHLLLPLLGLSGILGGGAGFSLLVDGGVQSTTLPVGLPWLPMQLLLDRLAAFFLFLVGALVVPVALYARGYLREFEHGSDSAGTLGFFTGLFVAGMYLVVMAADAFGFMVAWELMSLSSYFLVAFQHEQAANRRASFLYLLMAHLGALCILLAFGVLAMHGEGFTFEAMRLAHPGLFWSSVAFALALAGFGMKAGLFPFHAWLPEAHPVAPSHISALMSGVMLKVALYGFLRLVLDLIGMLHWGWGVALLLMGGVTALYGVVLALQQRDLKRLLAWSSMENLGIVFLALGLSLLFASKGLMMLAGLALVAALYHALNHALFKGLLFMAAGAVLFRTHERDLDRLGGLMRRMPWTGWMFLVGAASISALPPLNGFVSEWLVFQSALQAPGVGNDILSTLIVVSAAVLALTGALAAAVFVGAMGIGFLGQPRSRPARRAREVDLSMRLGMLLPALGCVLLGVLPVPVVRLLSGVSQALYGAAPVEATGQGWLWLTPISPQVASYAAPLVLAGLVLVWLLLRAVPAVTRARTRRDTPWDCGFGPLSSRMQYTASSFSMPARRLFTPVLGVQEQFSPDPHGGKYVLQVLDRSWSALYEPAARRVQWLARHLGFLQSGSIRVYLGYSFLTLLVLLWLISLS